VEERHRVAVHVTLGKRAAAPQQRRPCGFAVVGSPNFGRRSFAATRGDPVAGDALHAASTGRTRTVGRGECFLFTTRDGNCVFAAIGIERTFGYRPVLGVSASAAAMHLAAASRRSRERLPGDPPCR
jgi:hypothetical protein